MDIQQQQEEEEEEEKKQNGVVEVEVEVELDFEIWPVEHPMEPPDEDRPVKCPMPESSVINVTKFSHNVSSLFPTPQKKINRQYQIA